MLLKNPWKLQINGEANSANDVTFVSQAVDDSGSALTNVFLTGTINATTWVDAVETPASGDRLVRYVEIYNTGSINHDVGVRVSDGTTHFGQRAYTIVPSGSIRYVANTGWEVLEANGALRSAPVAGSSGSILFNDAGIVGGTTNFTVSAGDLTFTAQATTPSTPAASNVKMFGRDVGGRILPAIVGPSGLSTSLQPHFGRNKMGSWLPIGNATTVPLANGIAAPTATGTATTRNVATTNIVTQQRRLGYVSGTPAGNLAGFRNAAAQFFRGNGPGLGGFHLIIRFANSDAATVAGARGFVGLWATTTAPTNVDPSTLVNIIGVGSDAAEANLSIMHNDGAGVATKIALGAGFPARTLSTDAYELILFCGPNEATVRYRIENLVSGVATSGTISTDLPASTTLLGIQGWTNNGATGLAVGIDLINCYIETDY